MLGPEDLLGVDADGSNEVKDASFSLVILPTTSINIAMCMGRALEARRLRELGRG